MTPATEYRYTALRHDGGRAVSGTVVRFGDEANIEGVFRERMARNSLRPEDTILNLQHDRAKPLARLGGALQFVETNDALELRAEIVSTPSGDEALTLIEAGIIRGISVEMRVLRDEWSQPNASQLPLRMVTNAVMHGVSLVDRPAYPQSSIERWDKVHAQIIAAEFSVCRPRLYL